MSHQHSIASSAFDETLISISTQLLDSPTGTLPDVMDAVLEECRVLLGVDRISCFPNTKDITADWRSYTVSGRNIPSIKLDLSLEIKSQYQAMIHSGVILNSATHPQLLALAKELQDQAPINHILIPIQAMGKPWGAFAAANFNTVKDFDEQFIRSSTILGNIMASSMQRLQHYQDLLNQKEKVTALNKRLLEDSEEQLKIIARDLHDDIGQRLASLNLELGFINNQIEPKSQPAIKKAAADLSKITRDLQHISRHLHPAIIDKVGLYAAIESEAKKMAAHKSIALSLNLSQAILYTEEQKLHIYRISQEALSNVAKHASATKLAIVLACKENTVSLSFQDNGVGMSLEPQPMSSSLGIQSMRERADMIGAKIQFQTEQQPSGFRVTLQWPMPQKNTP